MYFFDEHVISTSVPEEMVRITECIAESVKRSGIQNGEVMALTLHTTTGITVNESLECLEYDIMDVLRTLVPQGGNYMHAHFLPTYGRTSANATGHLRGMILGNHCHFLVRNGQMKLGAAQDAYFVELDGPQDRKLMVSVNGE